MISRVLKHCNHGCGVTRAQQPPSWWNHGYGGHGGHIPPPAWQRCGPDRAERGHASPDGDGHACDFRKLEPLFRLLIHRTDSDSHHIRRLHVQHQLWKSACCFNSQYIVPTACPQAVYNCFHGHNQNYRQHDRNFCLHQRAAEAHGSFYHISCKPPDHPQQSGLISSDRSSKDCGDTGHQAGRTETFGHSYREVRAADRAAVASHCQQAKRFTGFRRGQTSNHPV